MDTKLKNRHKLAVFIMILTVMIPTFVIVQNYHTAYWEMKENTKEDKISYQNSEGFMGKFVEASYVLYNTEQTDERTSEHTKQLESFLRGDYYACYEEVGFLDFMSRVYCDVVDENNQPVTKMMSDVSSGNINEQNMNGYGIAITIIYDDQGFPTGIVNEGNDRQDQTAMLKKCLAGGVSSMPLGEALKDQEYVDKEIVLETPKNRTYFFAMEKYELD